MKKEIKGFLIIFLILCTVPLSCAQEQEVSMDNVVSDVLDAAPAANNITQEDILTLHIKEVIPTISTGELNAVLTMISKQWADTVDGSPNSDYVFYISYLNKSTSYPISGLSFTAQELYDKNPHYKSVVTSMDQIINDYGHMSRDKKIQFLKIEDPGVEYLQTFFMMGLTNQMKLYWCLNQTNDKMDILKSDLEDLNKGNMLTSKDRLDKAFSKYTNALMTAAYTYDLDIDDGVDYSDIWDIIDNHWSADNLNKNQLEDLEFALNDASNDMLALTIGLGVAQLTILGIVTYISKPLTFTIAQMGMALAAPTWGWSIIVAIIVICIVLILETIIYTALTCVFDVMIALLNEQKAAIDTALAIVKGALGPDDF